MSKGNYLQTILRSNKTVLTFKDIMLLWQETNLDAARVRLNYYVKKGDLYRIRKGIYAKSKTYSNLELATRIFTPSYISFETVLAKEGLIFQYYSDITIASYVTRSIKIDNEVYVYKKIKNTILINSLGIDNTQETSIATKERAFLDTLYSNVEYHFDNIRSLDWDKVFVLLPIYDNKRMLGKIKQLFKEWKGTQ